MLSAGRDGGEGGDEDKERVGEKSQYNNQQSTSDEQAGRANYNVAIVINYLWVVGGIVSTPRVGS